MHIINIYTHIYYYWFKKNVAALAILLQYIYIFTFNTLKLDENKNKYMIYY